MAVIVDVQGTGVPEQDLMNAIQAAAAAAGKLVEAQKALAKQTGRSKADLPMNAVSEPAAYLRLSALSQQRIHDILMDQNASGCVERGHKLEAAKQDVLETLRSAGAVRSEASSALALPDDLQSLPSMETMTTLRLCLPPPSLIASNPLS